jgi:hypothetical protein
VSPALARALASLAVIALVVGAVILWDRRRRRDARRPVGICDRRTYRDARERADVLKARGEGQLWHATMVGCRTWLLHELYTGSRSRLQAGRRVWLASELEQVEQAIAAYEAPAVPHWER